MKPNKIARDLRSPKYRRRIVEDKRRKVKAGYRKHKAGRNAAPSDRQNVRFAA